MKALDYVRTATSERQWSHRFEKVQSRITQAINQGLQRNESTHFIAAQILRDLLTDEYRPFREGE